ncbi:hypothetical protein [Caenispirillum bisanense]|uniref:hypothetical protein n=1 Tax=Caenispirillum bisanense TaxID=414052 RepID=UPI0031D24B17
MSRIAAAALTAAAILAGTAAATAPAVAQDSLTRGQVRSMLVTALQLELLARECDFFMTSPQRVAVAKIRDTAATALELRSDEVASLRGELDDRLRQQRDQVCLQDEPVFRQTLDALTTPR